MSPRPRQSICLAVMNFTLVLAKPIIAEEVSDDLCSPSLVNAADKMQTNASTGSNPATRDKQG